MDSTKKQKTWNITINFVPFKSEEVRNTSYNLWVKSFLRPKHKEDYVGIKTTLKEEGEEEWQKDGFHRQQLKRMQETGSSKS